MFAVFRDIYIYLCYFVVRFVVRFVFLYIVYVGLFCLDCFTLGLGAYVSEIDVFAFVLFHFASNDKSEIGSVTRSEPKRPDIR